MILRYRGMAAKIDLLDGEQIFTGQVLDSRTPLHFQGASADELRTEFARTVDEYLEECAESGVDPEMTFTGEVVIHMDPDLHRELYLEAADWDTSIDTIVISALEAQLEDRGEPGKKAKKKPGKKHGKKHGKKKTAKKKATKKKHGKKHGKKNGKKKTAKKKGPHDRMRRASY